MVSGWLALTLTPLQKIYLGTYTASGSAPGERPRFEDFTTAALGSSPMEIISHSFFYLFLLPARNSQPLLAFGVCLSRLPKAPRERLRP